MLESQLKFYVGLASKISFKYSLIWSMEQINDDKVIFLQARIAQKISWILAEIVYTSAVL